MDHIVTAFISGPCTTAPAHASGEAAHICGMSVYCAEHCPECHPTIDWRGGEPVVGEQIGLLL